MTIIIIEMKNSKYDLQMSFEISTIELTIEIDIEEKQEDQAEK